MDGWVFLNLTLPQKTFGGLHPAPSSWWWMHRRSGCPWWLPKPHLEQLLPSPPSLPPSNPSSSAVCAWGCELPLEK